MDQEHLKQIIINDSVHGHIQLDPLCVSIIDTPQFQRLRRLKQLGSAYYVYPGASHNRFEHSIGVCHLAGRFVEMLKANQKELDISEKDVLCVKIAGLCHDLGHGPFSHLFETFVNTINKSQPDYTHWEHEEASIALFDHLIKSNQKVKEGFSSRNLKKQDKTFIKQLIKGKVIEDQNTGRGRDKDFLYQIVANDKNGIDVDKWDYFARDCHMLGIRDNFDHQRCMQVARVCDVNIGRNKEKHICFRDKEQVNMYEMFHTRFMLHYRAYQHKTVTLIDAMILDAFKEANDNYRHIPGLNDRKKIMSEAIKDMVAYTHLTDDVLYDIGRSTDPDLEQSRQIIDRIVRRDFYELVYRETSQKKVEGEDIKRGMIKADRMLSDADFTVKVVKFDYGKKEKNPLDKVYYYRKSDVNKGIELLQRSDILTPKKFCEWEIRIIYKKSKCEKGKKNVLKAFTTWRKTAQNRKYKVLKCT